MDRLTLTWGLILSVLSIGASAYRNDLSSTRQMHGCVMQQNHVKQNTSGVPTTTRGSAIFNPMQHAINGNPNYSLECHLRTLNVDFWNYTFNREQIEKTAAVRITCSDKLFFESLLSPNQTFFQLRNLVSVQIESCKIRKVPKRVFFSLTKLKSLVIRTQNTEWRTISSVGLEVEPNAFEGLTQLEVLDLSQNNIWSLPNENSLCFLRNLLKLNMSNNRLSDIDDVISSHSEDSSSAPSGTTISRDNFCVLNIQNIDLSYNAIKRVGSDAFSRTKRLIELRLQNNLIGELEDSAFTALSNLRLLNISSNKLVALPPSVFKSNTNLQQLFLNNNSISALSSLVFAKMDQLLLLDLSFNILTSQWVKDDIFSGLIRLVVLKLSGNQLSYIDSRIFGDLISLQALHLDKNKIESIHPEAFSRNSNLHILDLSNNRLTYVDSKIFSNLFVLQSLYIDHNKIKEVNQLAFKNCTSLQDLGLADNLLQEVPVALQSGSLSLLKTLDIGENKIVQVNNNSFAGMRQLYGLRMVDNRLTELPTGFCEPLKKLRVLNLSQNRINKISSTGIACPELRVLRLDSNALEELPTTLVSQLPSLLWLNASENRLQHFEVIPPSVEWLDLSHNSIESLMSTSSSSGDKKKSSTTTTTYHLRVLDVSYNKLKHIDQSSFPISLETLRVNYNELNSVAPDTFSKGAHLRRVELIGNQIENLPLSSLRVPQIPSGRTLPEFYLGDNPFLCDCSMEWISPSRVNQLSILRQHPRIVDLDAIVCRTTFSRSTTTTTSISTTSSMGGNHSQAVIPLVEARPRDFLCPYTSHCFALCNCCDYDACDCEMTCPDNCTCYHDTAWSSNIVECSNLEYEEIPSRIPMDATEIYLDGNRMFQLGSHIFIGKKNLRVLYINNSHVENIRNKSFNGLKQLEVLRLEDNLLTELHGYEFADLESVREIYLHNNLLQRIAPDTFVNLKFLQVLRLDGNLLVDFNVWELSRNGYLNSVMLSGNPWSCDCEYLIPYRNWVASKTAIVVDFSLAKCQLQSDLHSWSGSEDDSAIEIISKAKQQQQLEQVQPLISSMCTADITFNYDSNGNNNEIEINNHISAMGGAAEKVANPQLPPPSENHLNNFSRLETDTDDNTFWVLILCITAFIIIFVVVMVVFRKEIYYWLCNRCCCPGKFPRTNNPSKASSPSSDDMEKLFDAYLLYSKYDEDMLLQKIVPELEEFPVGQKFRLCLHYRDLCLTPESPWNREMILSACDASKRLVIVLSRNFFQSEWATSTHFRTSIQSAISLHQKKLLFILLPDFDQSLSSEFGNIKNSCLNWTDKNFWEKFRKFMPNPVHTELANRMNVQQQSNCAAEQLPYNLVINPNLHLHHQQQQQQLQMQQHQQNTHHYHQNLIPFQIPMSRNNSLPPIPKHQIVLPAPLNWEQGANTNGLFNPHNNLQQNYHNTIISPENHSVHPVSSQLTPKRFGYNNEVFHLQSNHQNHHHPHAGHNNNQQQQPFHFSSSQQNQLQHHHPISVIPSHTHNHSHTPSQLSNFSSVCTHPQSHNQIDQNYSSSAVSSANGEELFDHVYSTLDSPLQSPVLSNNVIGFCPKGSNSNESHSDHNRTSSGISSGSSNAVSPSSPHPIRNGIINKLNECANNNRNQNASPNNGKMYFV